MSTSRRDESAYELLRDDPAPHVEKYGRQKGTDAQAEVIAYALDHPTRTIGEIASELGRSELFVLQTLGRADPDEWIDSDQDDGDDSPFAVPQSVNRSNDSVEFRWYIPGKGVFIEATAHEYCPRCERVVPVMWLVPMTEGRRLFGLECDHDAMINDDPVIDQLRITRTRFMELFDLPTGEPLR